MNGLLHVGIAVRASGDVPSDWDTFPVRFSLLFLLRPISLNALFLRAVLSPPFISSRDSFLLRDLLAEDIATCDRRDSCLLWDLLAEDIATCDMF